MGNIKLTTPLTDEAVAKLKIGDKVLLSGVIYTARDAAHKRMVDDITKSKPPFDLNGQVIYYVGPTPERPGEVIGSAGPTTAYRMDAYAPFLLERGLKATIAKGERAPAVIEAMKRFKTVYFVATGGAAVLIRECIKKAEVITYADLGAEAIRRLEVLDFPLTVANDIYGNDLFKEGVAKYRRG